MIMPTFASGAAMNAHGAVPGLLSNPAGCINVHPTVPPDVVIAPECKPGSESFGHEEDGIVTRALADSGAVEVRWTPQEVLPGLEAFEIRRGETPSTLSTLTATSPDARTYTDPSPLGSEEALWYQVLALNSEGDVISKSRPVLITADM